MSQVTTKFGEVLLLLGITALILCGVVHAVYMSYRIESNQMKIMANQDIIIGELMRSRDEPRP